MIITYKKTAELVPYDKNAKLHDEKQIKNVANSISRFGWQQPIVIDENGVVVIGHCRLEAAKKLKLKEVPVTVASGLTEDEIKELRIADNKTNESPWDLGLLAEDIEGLSFDGFDFDMPDVEMGGMDDKNIVEDDFDAQLPQEPKAKVGDIYQLGRHRLMCGDSTNIKQVSSLLDGNSIDVIFTDPPYNVAFNGRSGDFEVIKNDNLSDAEFATFIDSVANVIKTIDPAAYYVWCNWKFYGILQEKLDFKSCIVWAKNVFGLGKGYRHQHEFCLFNGSLDEEIHDESDLWEVKRDNSYVHPTQKPVELSCRALGNHKKAQNVLDLFGGSGSTLIGCEQMGRKCFMMELDPKYVDVIIERWEKFTGEKAVRLNGSD